MRKNSAQQHDAKLALISRNDAKFLSKLTGSSWCLKSAGRSQQSPVPSSDRRSPSPVSTQLQEAEHDRVAQHAATGNSAAAGGPCTAGTQFHDHAQEHAACEHTAVAQPAAVLPKDAAADSSDHGVDDDDDQQQVQQQLSCSPTGGPDGTGGVTDSSRARRGSPQWLLCTASKHLIQSASARTRSSHMPVHAERSLYATWAASQGAAAFADATSIPAAPVLVKSLPPSPVPAAAASHVVHHRRADPCSSEPPPSTSVAGSARAACTSPCYSQQQQQGLPVLGAEAAARTAAEAAAVLRGSPCGSNYHSTRAAALAAGISRSGTVDPKHQEWSRQQQQQPRAQVPRREDVQQLWQWLEDELQQLRHQLQQPQTAQRQQAQHQHSPVSSRPQLLSPTSPTAASPSRSVSPRCRQRARSPAAGGPPCLASMPLHEQARQLLELCKDAGGDALQTDLLQPQMQLYSTAFLELCGQASVGCVERGVLLEQLWSAHTVLLQAALQDRQAVEEQWAAAKAAAAAAAVEQQQLQQHHEDECVALRAISERHAAKADAAKQDFDKLKQQHDNLQELLKRLSGAQQLVQRVMDLEAARQQQELSIQQLRGQLTDSQQQLDVTTKQLEHWRGRAEAAEAVEQQQAQQLSCSTPRPRRDLGQLCDLLEPTHQQLVEQALVAGVPAPQLHRLLLGLSASGQDMRPWIALAGSCVPALQQASDAGQLYLMIKQHLAGCDAASLGKHLSSPDHHLQLLGQAVHIGQDHDTLLGLLVGSMGLSALPPIASSHQHTQPQTTAGAQTSGTASAVASIGLGLPLLPLVGVLATKYGHDAKELGGPVTEALIHAQLSTAARVLELEGRCKGLHREVVMLKCTLAEQRKHEQERVEAALKDQKRKIARREARQPTPLERFLQTKWGAVFTGIGLSEELPRVLRSNVPVNNKHMPKREAEKLAAEIWAFKDEQDAAGATLLTLAESAALFLERRFFAIPRLVTEVAYNMIYSLGQHTYDTDCNLFLRVFSGEVDESVRHEQQLLEWEIMRLLKLLDVSINHQATGWLHKADVKTALSGFFKSQKKVDRLAEVLEALDTDEAGDAVHYTFLFANDDQFSQGMTAEIIRSQHLAERLEMLQELEDVIRDAAEDHGTTTLTPAMLASCLRKAHKGLDSAAVAEYVARAFGPAWQEQQHRLSEPLGAVLKAVRSGRVPNMVRSAAAASAGSVSGAVNRIVPVGKFKHKLASALKVGFSRDGGTAGGAGSSSTAGGVGAARRVSRGFSAHQEPASAAIASAAVPGGGNKAKSRRATQEAVSAALAAVLSGDGGSKPKPKHAEQQPPGQECHSSATDADADADAVAAVVAVTDDGTAAQDVSGTLEAASTPVSAAAPAAVKQAIGSAGNTAPQQQDRPQSLEYPQHTAQPEPSVTLLPVSHERHPVVHESTSGGGAAAAAAAVRSGAAAARALTVDILSAMEAVRQSWLKEEEVKLVSLSSSGGSGSDGTMQAMAAAGVMPGASAAHAGSAQGSRLCMAHDCADSALSGDIQTNGMSDGGELGPGVAAAAVTSDVSGPAGCSYYPSASGSSRQYTAVPGVPVLRLAEMLRPGAALEVIEADQPSASGSSSRTGGSSSAGTSYRLSHGSSVPSSGRASSWGGSSSYAADSGDASGGDGSMSWNGQSAAPLEPGNGGGSSSRSLLPQQQQQRGVKTILSRMQSQQGSHRPTKHVQINTADSTMFAFSASQQADAGADMTDNQQHAPADGLCCSPKGQLWPRDAAGPDRPAGFSSEGRNGSSTAGAAPAPAAVSRSSSGSTRHPERVGSITQPSLRTQHSMKVAQQEAGIAGHGVQRPGSSSSSSPTKKRGGSKTSKHAAMLPQLLLTDADDACAVELAATPAGAAAEPHSEVCFTPQAPAEGGKRNAFLMRRLNKGKSLKQLEEVMLAVAGGELGVEDC